MTPLTNIKQISASKNHTLFLLNDGTVWSVGSGQYKQLGNGGGTAYQLTRVKADANNILTDIVHVSAGSWHSLFVKSNGDVLSCGYNNVGQLGYGPTGFTPTYPSPVMEADQTTALTDVKFACAGSNFSMFIKNDGTVFSCGDNSANQMMPQGGNYNISDNGLSPYNFKLVQAWNNVTDLPITGCERLVASNDDNMLAGSQRVYWFLDDDTVMISGYTGKSDGIIDGIRYVVTESEDGEKAKGIKEVDFSFRIAMFAKSEENPNKVSPPPEPVIKTASASTSFGIGSSSSGFIFDAGGFEQDYSTSALYTDAVGSDLINFSDNSAISGDAGSRYVQVGVNTGGGYEWSGFSTRSDVDGGTPNHLVTNQNYKLSITYDWVSQPSPETDYPFFPEELHIVLTAHSSSAVATVHNFVWRDHLQSGNEYEGIKQIYSSSFTDGGTKELNFNITGNEVSNFSHININFFLDRRMITYQLNGSYKQARLGSVHVHTIKAEPV